MLIEPDLSGIRAIGRLADLLGLDRRLDADYRHVETVWRRMGGISPSRIAPRLARELPTLEDAAREVYAAQGHDPDNLGVKFDTREIVAAGRSIAVRLYSRLRMPPLRPVIFCLAGSDWVSGELSRYDAVPRMLAHRTGALVAAIGVRQAPEHPFPAAHEDAWTAWRWMLDQLESWKCDSKRIGLFGDGAGANLALDVGLRSRGTRLSPTQLVLVSPHADPGIDPQPDRDLDWARRHLLAEGAADPDARLYLSQRKDLAGLPATTIIHAVVEPVADQAAALADTLSACGTVVERFAYEGVGRDFFRLGLLVNKSAFAQAQAAEAFNRAFMDRYTRAA